MASPTLFLTKSKIAVCEMLSIIKGLYSSEDRHFAVDILYRRLMRLFPDEVRTKYETLSMWWSVGNLKRNGLKPRTVVDIGAFVGGWTAKGEADFLR